MNMTWGNTFKISLFGGSHGESVGVKISGLKSGLSIDFDKIAGELSRRAPSLSFGSTKRNESDAFEFSSGFDGNKTNGDEICAVIKNTDAHSEDYIDTKRFPRPSHADYTLIKRFGENCDIRGGGICSGRMTAPLVLAGAICKQLLEKSDICIGAHIYSIGDVYDEPFDMANISEKELLSVIEKKLPIVNDGILEDLANLIEKVSADGDSIGGITECAVLGVPAGIGTPVFASLESVISSLLFAIPAVKGVEFGQGFGASVMYGSEHNDEMYFQNGEVKTISNNSGGILGGISNSMPIIFKAAFKPTPSISMPQCTVDLKNMENTTIEIKGRHDVCIVPRAVPVVEAVAAIAIFDTMLTEGVI